jgi:hypothetical protein
MMELISNLSRLWCLVVWSNSDPGVTTKFSSGHDDELSSVALSAEDIPLRAGKLVKAQRISY